METTWPRVAREESTEMSCPRVAQELQPCRAPAAWPRVAQTETRPRVAQTKSTKRTSQGRAKAVGHKPRAPGMVPGSLQVVAPQTQPQADWWGREVLQNLQVKTCAVQWGLAQS